MSFGSDVVLWLRDATKSGPMSAIDVSLIDFAPVSRLGLNNTGSNVSIGVDSPEGVTEIGYGGDPMETSHDLSIHITGRNRLEVDPISSWIAENLNGFGGELEFDEPDGYTGKVFVISALHIGSQSVAGDEEGVVITRLDFDCLTG